MKINNIGDLPSVASYLSRIGAEVRSMYKAVIMEVSGNYFRDTAVVMFDRDGKVTCRPSGNEPTEAEQAKIIEEFATATFPKQVLATDHDLEKLPQKAKDAGEKNLFIYRDFAGEIIMLQVRYDNAKGKNYVPYTYYDDGEWRAQEPEGKLPLLNLDKIGDNTTAIVHEGGKSAKYIQWMIEKKTPEAQAAFDSHPWAAELDYAVHCAWQGGALSPSRTDWSALVKRGIKRVIIVADNDFVGLAAVPDIAKEIRCETYCIQFSNQWPASFDLFDPFPDNMFRKIGEKRYYVGPSFRDCLHVATWMTDVFEVLEDGAKKPKKVVSLRPHASGIYEFVSENQEWVCVEFPEIVMKTETLDAVLSAFSDSQQTSKLLLKNFTGRTAKFTYQPAERGRKVIQDGKPAINLFVPSNIKAQPGDVTPFLTFMEYLIPDPSDRHQVLRWFATLIGRPDIRMPTALLLISSTQGTGKTTAIERILAPILGINNCSFVSEDEIVNSAFNSWVAQKRLAVVAEIYSGSSWKAANRLKSTITDKYVTINEKYRVGFRLENQIAIAACSNSENALRIEDSDRRWLIPGVTETKWPLEKFNTLYDWLASGGLQIVAYWAESIWTDYIMPGEPAPISSKKKEMIFESRGTVLNMATDLGKALMAEEQPTGIAMLDIMNWLRANHEGRFYETELDVKKALREVGVSFSSERISIDSRTQNATMNHELNRICSETEGKSARNQIWKQHRRKPEDLMNSAF